MSKSGVGTVKSMSGASVWSSSSFLTGGRRGSSGFGSGRVGDDEFDEDAESPVDDEDGVTCTTGPCSTVRPRDVP
jgi:hypothetical protein